MTNDTIGEITGVWFDELSYLIRSDASKFERHRLACVRSEINASQKDKIKHLTRLYNLAKVRRDKVQMSSLEKQMILILHVSLK